MEHILSYLNSSAQTAPWIFNPKCDLLWERPVCMRETAGSWLQENLPKMAVQLLSYQKDELAKKYFGAESSRLQKWAEKWDKWREDCGPVAMTMLACCLIVSMH